MLSVISYEVILQGPIAQSLARPAADQGPILSWRLIIKTLLVQLIQEEFLMLFFKRKYMRKVLVNRIAKLEQESVGCLNMTEQLLTWTQIISTYQQRHLLVQKGITAVNQDEWQLSHNESVTSFIKDM